MFANVWNGQREKAMKRKNISLWMGILAFVLICAGIAGFLFTFTYFRQTQFYIVWNEAYRIGEDGVKTPCPVDAYGSVEGLDSGDTYVLSARLPQGPRTESWFFCLQRAKLHLNWTGGNFIPSGLRREARRLP